MRASGRYQYIKDLLVGLTRSLTAAIDAKDAYTYGHSERVARAAVELGRELGLQEDELSDIYLAGLLHDIGKIGIRDDVLTKRGPLTDEEFKHIQQHAGHRPPHPGRPPRDLAPAPRRPLPPRALRRRAAIPRACKGDAIPLLARILAVADSFDAMNTSRPYRTAMPPERVDQILRQGAGTQWDPLVIDAYVRCRDRLTAIRQRGLGESLRDALDGALRHGHRPNEFASMEVSMIDEPRPTVLNRPPRLRRGRSRGDTQVAKPDSGSRTRCRLSGQLAQEPEQLRVEGGGVAHVGRMAPARDDDLAARADRAHEQVRLLLGDQAYRSGPRPPAPAR